MRKPLITALGATVALVAAAVAFAVVPAVVGVSEATATFHTDKVVNLKTRECTGADGVAYKVTDGRYTGVVTSANVVLAGPLTIHAKTTYSVTNSLGYVEGSFKVRDDDSRLHGKFSGTLKAGKLVGFLTANSRGNHAKVLGNITADFVPGPVAPSTIAFSSGQLGSAPTAALAVVAGPVCKSPKAPKPAKPVRPVHVHGTVTALSATEITVTSKGPTTTKCAIALTSPPTTGFLDKRVEMTCEAVGVAPSPVVWTLTKLKLHK